MKKKKALNKTMMQVIKASRKQSREEEIEAHGKPINNNNVVVSKKVYNRKKNKADYRKGNLPYSLSNR